MSVSKPLTHSFIKRKKLPGLLRNKNNRLKNGPFAVKTKRSKTARISCGLNFYSRINYTFFLGNEQNEIENNTTAVVKRKTVPRKIAT